MERYTAMYPWTAKPPGRSGDGLRCSASVPHHPGLYDSRREPRAPAWDFTHECFVCVASALSSSNYTGASATPSCHRHQRRASLSEIAEARHQLDEELANLHRELGEDHRPCNLRPAPQPTPQQVLVQEQRREGNSERQDRRPAAEQPRAHAPTPPARGSTRKDNRHASEGANVNANVNAPMMMHRHSLGWCRRT
jgi:hypothetical protein